MFKMAAVQPVHKQMHAHDAHAASVSCLKSTHGSSSHGNLHIIAMPFHTESCFLLCDIKWLRAGHDLGRTQRTTQQQIGS
jgi:hypothetical protein